MLKELLIRIGGRKIYALFLGILYVLISYGTAKIFFAEHTSLAMIFFVTLLLIPSTAKLLAIEEAKERSHGLKNFLKNHYILMEIFLFLFIGIFLGYLITGYYDSASKQYQDDFLKNQGISGIKTDVEKIPQFIGIISSNISVIVIAFVLSVFYGAGALFLIVLNASIFASFMLKISELAAKMAGLAMMIHFIPEVFGFLLAAMAGGIISKAIAKEKIGSKQFRNVVKDSTIMLLLSILVIVIAALIEVYLTPAAVKLIV